MSKLLVRIGFIGLFLLISAILLPRLSVAQTCTPPVYTSTATVSVDARDNCNAMGWTNTGPIWSGQVNKQAGSGGNFTFTVTVPTRTGGPPLNSGGKVQAFCDGASIGTYSLNRGPKTDAYFVIPVTNNATATLSIYVISEANDCSGKITPAFTISDIKFTPEVKNVPITTDYSGTVTVDARDNCNAMGWTNTGPIWSGQVNKQAGSGGNFTFTVTVPARTGGPPLNSGGKVQAFCDGISIGTHSLNNGPSTDAYFVLPATNSTTVTLSVYVVSDASDCAGKITPAFTISNIKATTLGPPRLATPQVADVELCQAGTARLVVTNPSPQAEYYWFTDPNATTEVFRGTTYDFPATGNTQVYVQAFPANGAIDCPSARKTVNITVYNVSAAFSVDASLSGPAPYLQNYTLGFSAVAGYDTYTWNWGDNTPPEVRTSATSTHAYAQPGTYEVTLTVYKAYPKVADGGCLVTSKLSGLVVTAALCEIQSLSGGQVQQNTRSGAISYVVATDKCLPVVSFECLGDASTIVDEPALKKVVSATATAFADQLVPTSAQSPNPYLAGQWRTAPQASYSFRTSLSPSPNPQNYSFGTFTLRPFDWENSLRARPAAWLTAAVTEQLSPNGDVLQERDPLGITSTAKFGYGTMLGTTNARVLPYLQAHNADYTAVLFESFENSYALGGKTIVEDELELPASVQLIKCKLTDTDAASCIAHTGNVCALLTNRQLQLLPIPLTSQLAGGGLLVKVWLRLPDYVPAQFTASVLLYRAGVVASSVAMTSTVRTGDWLLFEGRVPMNTTATGASLGENLTPLLQFSTAGASAVYADDVRVQPTEAQMTTYVYDPVSLRLLASFDDQHFALRYQYNAEGKLVRKQAETMRGLKTLQETHYHTPASNQVND